MGLEQSGHKFVWVVRDADKGDVFAGGERRPELPKGFEERVEGRGMVVRDWAPQLEILEHPSTGNFSFLDLKKWFLNKIASSNHKVCLHKI